MICNVICGIPLCYSAMSVCFINPLELLLHCSSLYWQWIWMTYLHKMHAKQVDIQNNVWTIMIQSLMDAFVVSTFVVCWMATYAFKPCWVDLSLVIVMCYVETLRYIWNMNINSQCQVAILLIPNTMQTVKWTNNFSDFTHYSLATQSKVELANTSPNNVLV